MDLNLSDSPIAQELDLNRSDIKEMTTQLPEGIVKKPEVKLSGEVECDEEYIVAGHNGNPLAVQQKGRAPRRNRLRGTPGRGTLESEKPPVFGMIQRGGEMVIQILPNVQIVTTAPLIQETIEEGSLVYTDEYNIYSRLEEWDMSMRR